MRLPIRRVAALAIAGAAFFAASGAFAEPAKKHVVTIENLRYEPATIVVKKGDTVTWVNKDIFPHTVTAAGKFDSKDIAPNGRWAYHATRSGEFPYICTLHPNMKGTLKVE